MKMQELVDVDRVDIELQRDALGNIPYNRGTDLGDEKLPFGNAGIGAGGAVKQLKQLARAFGQKVSALLERRLACFAQ